jgi:hypothetical protein
MPSEREIEHILRDAGCTVKEAKAILSKGYGVDLRDVGRAPMPPKAAQPLREVESAKKDRVSDLLTRAEVVAPSTT